MPPTRDTPEATSVADLGDALSGFFDPDWYLSRYPDVGASGTEPLHHYVHFGAAEGRDPNRFFDGAWYLTHYPDVANSGQHPLLHYLQMGAAELRTPHPRLDAAYYVDQHPEAAANPLLYHLLFGIARRLAGRKSRWRSETICPRMSPRRSHLPILRWMSSSRPIADWSRRGTASRARLQIRSGSPARLSWWTTSHRSRSCRPGSIRRPPRAT